MVIKTASPGIIINEVDLTKGTSDAITTNIAAFAGPFEKGPVDELVLINTENEFVRVFGNPTDENYEYWWTVSNFLEYGGVCFVVRCDDTSGGAQTMRNAADLQDWEDGTEGWENGNTGPYVMNRTHFKDDIFEQGGTQARFIAQNPGIWANGLALAVIDRGADYQYILKTTGIQLAADGSSVVDNTEFSRSLTPGDSVGSYIKVAAGIGTSNLVAGDFVEAYLIDGSAPITEAGQGFIVDKDDAAGWYMILVTSGSFPTDLSADSFKLTKDAGSTITDAATAVYAIGELEYYSNSEVNTSIQNFIFKPQTYTKLEGMSYGWTQYPRDNQKVISGGPANVGDTYIWDSQTEVWSVIYVPQEDDLVTDGTNVFKTEIAEDWYNQQTAFAGVPWYRFASRPGSSGNAIERGAAGDELNIILYDSVGFLTGSKGNMLEGYFGVSKLHGATTNEGNNNYYVDVINTRSAYIFANQPLPEMTGADSGLNQGLVEPGFNISDGVVASYVDAKTYYLDGGVDPADVTLGELQTAYNKLDTEDVPVLDYILQGPAMGNLDDSVAKANFLISIAESRKDCMCFLSPPRYAVIGQFDTENTTRLVIEWANQLSSTSYGVMDSGYKYTYDRFNDKYRYIPLNGDVAGLVVNTSLVAEPWFSPAGLSRGQIRNVVKLPYSPSKTQRDELYTARVNPVVTYPGEGHVLWGDKTMLAYSSAFDRINVRRLFLVIEREVAKISRVVLFELNDEVTRTLFKNNVNPYLRDVQARRGMYDFLVVCDETNNTPEVIDRNEFIADLYIKPARSINFITLNFIATKTGVSFDESIALFRGAGGGAV